MARTERGPALARTGPLDNPTNPHPESTASAAPAVGRRHPDEVRYEQEISVFPLLVLTETLRVAAYRTKPAPDGRRRRLLDLLPSEVPPDVPEDLSRVDFDDAVLLSLLNAACEAYAKLSAAVRDWHAAEEGR